MTEEESEIYDLFGLLLRKGGVRIGIPILVGAGIIAIGLSMLYGGFLLGGSVAISIGVALMAYGIYELNKRRKAVVNVDG